MACNVCFCPNTDLKSLLYKSWRLASIIQTCLGQTGSKVQYECPEDRECQTFAKCMYTRQMEKKPWSEREQSSSISTLLNCLHSSRGLSTSISSNSLSVVWFPLLYWIIPSFKISLPPLQWTMYVIPDSLTFFTWHIVQETKVFGQKLIKYLEEHTYLTLSFDGWSSHDKDEIYTSHNNIKPSFILSWRSCV